MRTNLVDISFQSGISKQNNSFGMREIQARVFEQRNSKRLIIKAPPASGKSRALMYVALDKMQNQGVKKTIVAVPERTIGKSFQPTNLTSAGFFADWQILPENNLVLSGSSDSKVERTIDFIKSDDNQNQVLLITHATLRFAYAKLTPEDFDNTLVAIDEFHHVSSDGKSVIGQVLNGLLTNQTTHILAMTGSYFRGDTQMIIDELDETQFDKVDYSYKEQFEGYTYLKRFKMSYQFYRGNYLSSLFDLIDINDKSIIYIPRVNSNESTKSKYQEVDAIIDFISGGGQITKLKSGLFEVQRPDGKILHVADLVSEDGRDKVLKSLDNIQAQDLDFIVALGMAKEGFDWPFAQRSIAVGYRNSMTEVVQMIGRITRDAKNKTEAEFINLVVEPDVSDKSIVNLDNLMNLIATALLVKYLFGADIVNRDDGIDINDLVVALLQSKPIQMAIVSGTTSAIINKELIPRFLIRKYPYFDLGEIESIRLDLVKQLGIGDNPEENSVLTSMYRVIADNFSNTTIEGIKELIQPDIADNPEVKKFYEIMDFVTTHGRVPQKSSDDTTELLMWARLNSLRMNPKRAVPLRKYDQMHLLDT
ncbi:MAG: DEAD/DEAH box helicase family protein [Lactobacillaceae bacterium]|jgi:superfamily II DNA or RNA helicase|nr:DEAD/DEAH box helicase family protein [Lactobacillaceae bacterium]